MSRTTASSPKAGRPKTSYPTPSRPTSSSPKPSSPETRRTEAPRTEVRRTTTGHPRTPEPPGSPRLARVGRVLRQDPADPWAVKLLPRVVLGLAAAYTLFSIAASSGSSFVTVCVLLMLGLLVWLLRRRGQLLLALASTTVTAALTGYFAAVGDAARWGAGLAVSGTAVFGYWALAGMALLGPWMVKEHPGRRGVTVLVVDVILVIASCVGMFLPEAGVPVGFLGVIGVLAARGGALTTAHRLARRAPGALWRFNARSEGDS
ncbi:hypothetical protein ACFVXA_35265 [Streptomyces sp. NPDC058246]|uniref:hypothetical protein n=1 Tax=unclassified Streptomyces TaxID=2593676 RepID=UPI0036E88D36